MYPGAGAGVAKVATLEAQMTSLHKMVDDLRAGDKQTLEALKHGLSHDELQKMVADLRAGEKTLEALKQGSSAGDKTLEALMTSLQQLADEIRAGDGPLEARTGETAGDGTQVIKEHPEVSKKGSAGAGTPEAWREGIPHKVEGCKGAIMIGADSAAEEKSVARGLIIDPGGEIIKVHTAEIEQARGGKSSVQINAKPHI